MRISKNDNIVIVGGDARQKYLYDNLLENGFSVIPYDVPDVPVNKDLAKSVSYGDFKNTITACNVFILPIPFSRDGSTVNSKFSVIALNTFLSHIHPGSVIIGGCINDDFTKKCHAKNIAVYDLMENPSFELLNTIATAEGAIAEAVMKSPLNIHFSNCLVTGYGKCAKAICSRLGGLNANVTVCARKKEHQISAFESGYSYINFGKLSDSVEKYDFIFNTVPAMVLTEDVLKNVNKQTTIIDIASKPGGTDFGSCERLGINAWLCLSLPGKYSPKSSADIIYDCIINQQN